MAGAATNLNQTFVFRATTRGVLSILARGAGFAITVVVARSASSQDAGTFFIFLSTASLIGTLLALGFPESLARSIARLDATQGQATASSLFRTAQRAQLGATLLLAGLTALVVLMAGSSFAILASVAAGGLIGQQLTSAPLLRIRGRAFLAESAMGLVPVVFLLALLLLRPRAATSLIGLKSLTEAVAAAILGSIAYRLSKNRGEYAPLKEMLREAFPFWMLYLAWLALQQADVLLLGAIQGVAAVAFYAPILRLADVSTLVLAAITPYLIPRIAQLRALEEHRRIRALTADAAKFVFALMAIVVAPLLLAPGMIVKELFDISQASAEPVARLLAITYLITGLLGVGSIVLQTLYEDWSVAVTALAALLVSIAVYAFLISAFGPIGAAAGSLICYTSLQIVNAVRLYRKVGASVVRADVVITVVATCVAIFVLHLWGIARDNLLGLAAGTFAVALVSLGTAWLTARQNPAMGL